MNAATLVRLRRWTRGVPRQLASGKMGSILIIAVFGFTLLAAFFPYTQAAGFVRRVGEALALDSLAQASELGFQERFESPAFTALVFALGLSLCLSLYFRVRSEFLRWRAERASRLQDAGKRQSGGPPGVALATAVEELKRRGYRVRAFCASGGWQVRGEKGGAGVLGSVLFHIGVLLVLVAVVLSTSASFRASVKLTEGQAFDARTDAYGSRKVGRWYAPPGQPLTFRLVRVDPNYGVNGATTVASIVEPTLEGKASRFLEQAPVYVSNGLRHAGVTLHQGRETGYAPLIVIEDAAGKRLVEGYTQLATAAGAERESYLDYVYVKDSDVSVELELLPDAVYRDGAYVSRSAALKRPVLRVVVRQRGDTVLDQFVPVTRDVSAGGYTVYFGGVRRWSQIDVSDAPGVPVLMAATLLGSLGLALRLLRVRRRVVVTLSGEGNAPGRAFELTGASEKFQRSFEEELGAIRTALAARRSGRSSH